MNWERRPDALQKMAAQHTYTTQMCCVRETKETLFKSNSHRSQRVLILDNSLGRERRKHAEILTWVCPEGQRSLGCRWVGERKKAYLLCWCGCCFNSSWQHNTFPIMHIFYPKMRGLHRKYSHLYNFHHVFEYNSVEFRSPVTL